MNDSTIKAIVDELAPLLINRTAGKLFQLARVSLVIDFRTHDNRFLLLSTEPSAPRLYMIERRLRDIEKQALHDSSFASLLRKHIGGARLLALSKDVSDRIVRFSFVGEDIIGNQYSRTLVAQLTGRAANLFLLDEQQRIIDALRTLRGEGQQIGDEYEPPLASPTTTQASQPALTKGSFASLSEAADGHYRALEATQRFNARAAAFSQQLRKLIAQKTKLQRSLQQDLVAHGDAQEHQRIGNLLLANLTTAERRGNFVTLTDYYAAGEPRIELEIDENLTLQEEAARRFAHYTKAKRAAQEINHRLASLETELTVLAAREAELRQIIDERDEAALEVFDNAKERKQGRPSRAQKPAESIPGARRYRSSDGYEILVGRAARDNDQLTFRIARPYDLWLHAADYPGSHVVVRNPTRKDIPHRTIIEAAQLAAQFSQARRDAKVDVHYTQRKFLSKPKKAAPGLVRMSSFRSLTVEPRESVERI